MSTIDPINEPRPDAEWWEQFGAPFELGSARLTLVATKGADTGGDER